MKFEKLSENKIKITLTLEELLARKINIKDIEKDSTIARNLFLDLISETELHDEFISSDSQLFIEASSDNNNLFVVTITKVELIPELKDYENIPTSNSTLIDNKKSKAKTKKSKTKISYKVSSYIYEYDNLDTIIDMSSTLKKQSCFIGKNSLYKYEDKYFIIFSKSSVRNAKFIKTFVILSEYSKSYYNNSMFVGR